jgi:Uma2 family endonuclease
MSNVAHLNDSAGWIPPLVAGDRLTRDEFERRYGAMPEVKKAELIEGIVYMPSPVSHAYHSAPHAKIVAWLVHYAAHTPGVDAGDNATVRLDLDNEPQPDAFLRIKPASGGQTSDTREGYVEGPPELVAEVTASSAAYDLHVKKTAYRRNGVREYVVWRVLDPEIDWFTLSGGSYARLAPGKDGIFRSRFFPGLWLDVERLLQGDMKGVLATLGEGIASPEHAAFVAGLR